MDLLRRALVGILTGSLGAIASLQATPLTPHPQALPNTHKPGVVDVQANVQFIVSDPRALPGIVLDETEATLVGDWQYSTHTPPYLGIGYLHDRKESKGEKSVTWTLNLPEAGHYEVRISHCYNVRRATTTPVTIRHRGGETTVRINQQDVPKHHRLFRSLGVYRFQKTGGFVRISTGGTEGKYVIADAVQLLPVTDQKSAPSPAMEIGRAIFMDETLSNPRGQSCASCHQSQHAFADPRRVSPGAVPGRKGRRNAPSLMYSALIPSMAFEDLLTPDGEEIFAWEGGLFLDGRSRDQFEQVIQPFFDRNEMNLSGPEELAARLRKTWFAEFFQKWVGAQAWKDDDRLNYHARRALVEFLKEPFLRPFDARIDDHLAGKKDALTEAELRGLEVYQNKAGCAQCHPLIPDSWPKPLLSDFGYDNLGVPARAVADPGLGGHTGKVEERGMFRAPGLRNVALTAPYMHNGSIATLREVIEFYNKRDVEKERWGRTDYPETVNRADLGNLQLTEQEVSDLVALMEAFSDRSLLTPEVRRGRFLPRAPKDVPSTRSRALHFPDWTHRLHPAFSKLEERAPAQ